MATFINGVEQAAAGAGGATTREGGQTTEATTTSTSDADLLTASSLSVAGTSPMSVQVNHRKTSGAAGATEIGLKLNTTEVLSPFTVTAGTNAEANHLIDFSIGSRIAGYLSSGGWRALGARGGTTDSAGNAQGFTGTDMPTATITAIIIRGNAQDGAITLAADEMHVYSWATS